MSDEGSALARVRWAKRETKVCPFCKQEFSGPPGQTYCTRAHQNAAAAKRWRDRHRRPRAATSLEAAE